MRDNCSDFKEKTRGTAPAPHDETPSYKRFSAIFSPLSFVITILLSYLLAAAFARDHQSESDFLQNWLPIVKPRIDFLRSHGIYSESGYIATVLCAIFAIPAIILVNSFFYWNLVLRPGLRRGINANTFYSVLFSTSVMILLFWVVFISVPENYDPHRPGFAAAFFWPIFPTFGAVSICLLAFIIFSALVYFFKVVVKEDNSNG